MQNDENETELDMQIVDDSAEKSTCQVKLKVICEPNLIFDRYNINLYIDNTYKTYLEHGSTGLYTIELEKGTMHTLRIENEELENEFSSDIVVGSVNFTVLEDTVLGFTVHCAYNEIQIDKKGVSENEFNDAKIVEFEQYYPSDKEINERGYIHNVNKTFKFEKSQITINKVMVRFMGDAYYGLFIDYNVKNTSDESVIWTIREHDNVYGEITTETMTNEWLGRNSNYMDVDFPFETMKDRGEINVNGEERGNVLLLFNNWDEHYKTIKLRENECMKINLYYTENGNKNKYTIDLNKPN